MKFLQDHAADLAKGIVSTSLSLFAVISSFQEQLESWLRVSSLAGAIIVSALTAASLIRNSRKK